MRRAIYSFAENMTKIMAILKNFMQSLRNLKNELDVLNVDSDSDGEEEQA